MSKIMNMRETSPVKTFIGPGSSRMAGMLFEQMGVKKVFVVCDAGVKNAGLVDGALASMEEKNIETYVYDSVMPDAPDTLIDEASAICREQGCQAVLGVGGGSSIDTAKCVAMMLTNPGKIEEYVLNPTKPRANGAPLIIVPTTSGTGSDVTNALIIHIASKGAKIGIQGKDLFATVSLLDPMLTAGLPKKMTTSTAMDALAHCVEAMLSPIANPICDLLSLEGIRLIVNNIEKVVENGNDLEARQNMMLAAYYGGMSLNDGACNLGHAVAHTLGSMYHIPHGELCAVVTPMVIEYFAEIFPEKILKIADAMGVEIPADASNTEAAVITANAVRALRAKLELPKFSDFTFGYEDLPKVAEGVMQENCTKILFMCAPNNVVTLDEILAPLQKEYNLD